MVQVAYATMTQQHLQTVELPTGSRVEDAITQSGVLDIFPEIDLQKNRVGIYGKLKALDALLREHDRVEIYRPLVADPREARRNRVGKNVALAVKE